MECQATRPSSVANKFCMKVYAGNGALQDVSLRDDAYCSHLRQYQGEEGSTSARTPRAELLPGRTGITVTNKRTKASYCFGPLKKGRRSCDGPKHFQVYVFVRIIRKTIQLTE